MRMRVERKMRMRVERKMRIKRVTNCTPKRY